MIKDSSLQTCEDDYKTRYVWGRGGGGVCAHEFRTHLTIDITKQTGVMKSQPTSANYSHEVYVL